MKTFKQACDYAEYVGITSFFWFILNWVVDIDIFDEIRANNIELFIWAERGREGRIK